MMDYADALKGSTRDLVEAWKQGELGPCWFREREIAALCEFLLDGRSVLLVGEAGAGKTAVLHGLAAALADSDKLGLLELTTARVLVGTRYLGDWQTKLDSIVQGAMRRSAVLCFKDVGNLRFAGRALDSPDNMFDAILPFVESGVLRIVGEASLEQLRDMERDPRFRAAFEKVLIGGLGPQQVDQVLERVASSLELSCDAATRATLVDLTDRFLPARTQPGPALRLMEQVAHYRAEKRAVGEPEPMDPAFVGKVFSIYSGLPPFVVSASVTKPAQEIRAWFAERLVGQDEAIDAVVECIALYKANLHDPKRPIGTFLFVGPTGVGKTELARALATFLFGSPKRLLRFDLSEFKDYHAFELLIGNPREPTQPARLIDPVRTQPFQVVLLDELEKAHENIWDLLLPVLDEGRLSPPGGKPVDFRNTIIIATSNVGAGEAWKSVGFGDDPDERERSLSIRSALDHTFRPEFLNRFTHLVVFQALSREQLRTVARKELKSILARRGIIGRHLVVNVSDEALDHVIDQGIDSRYGARALKRMLQHHLVLPLALALMERSVDPGAMLNVDLADGRVRVRLVDTAESRKHRKEQAPVRTPEGRKASRRDLGQTLKVAQKELDEIAAKLDESFLHAERERILELRKEPDFWAEPAHAARDLRDLDRLTATIDRLGRLRAELDERGAEMAKAVRRSELERLGRELMWSTRRVRAARRELVFMGRDRFWDALVLIRPSPGGHPSLTRDLLVEMYRRWAEGGRRQFRWLHEPRGREGHVLALIDGPWAYGYLRLESGTHRVRQGEDHGAATVQVLPWTDAQETPEFGTQLALKAAGIYGGRIRSRVECGHDLVLQNDNTLAQNRDLAAELMGAWQAAPPASMEVVRRYDLEPFKMRDVLSGITSGRADALRGRRFHELLCQRIDLVAEGSEV
jgi:ATP-dependent Clp protease ATP-binding subunit ClpC